MSSDWWVYKAYYYLRIWVIFELNIWVLYLIGKAIRTVIRGRKHD